MKLAIATLLAGGTLVTGDLPSVGYDECQIVDVIITTGEPTFIDPEPAATAMQIIEYCGQRVVTSTGSFVNQPAFKSVDVDLDHAEIIVQAAGELLGDGDVYLGGG